MSTACVRQPTPIEDLELKHRQQVLAGMNTATFRELFNGEFANLRKAVLRRDWAGVEETIQALEACAVSACEQFDEVWELTKHRC